VVLRVGPARLVAEVLPSLGDLGTSLSLSWTAILVCDLLWWRVSLPGFVFVAWFVELPEEFGWLVPPGVRALR